MSAPDSTRLRWSMVVDIFTRPQPVSISMVVLAALVPFYIVIADIVTPGRTLHAPELALDRVIPLQAPWAVVYCGLYILVLLPVFVVHQQDHIRLTIRAYLMVWLAAYAGFLSYPTIAPRPGNVIGTGFFAWVLRSIYSSDPPYNCFPSLHVAQSFLSALTCSRVHRGVGIAAGFCASLIGVATLFTKQHYAVDVIAGMILACLAYFIFVRGYPREAVPELDRRLAPFLALAAVGVYVLIVAGFWIAYRMGVTI